MQAPPSGAAKIPSDDASSRPPSIASRSETAIAQPPEARMARSMSRRAERLRHPQSGRDGVGVLPELDVVLPLLEGAHHRGAALGLHGDHLRPLRTDPAERLHLLECLPHADQPDAAARGIEDRGRQASSRTARRPRSPSSSCPRCGRAPSASRCRTSRSPSRLHRPGGRSR